MCVSQITQKYAKYASSQLGEVSHDLDPCQNDLFFLKERERERERDIHTFLITYV